MTLSGPGIAHPLRADMLIYEVVMGLFKWLSGAERMEDSKRVLLEKVVEKMRSGADEFAVEVRPGEFGWNGDIDRRLMDYVTQGLDELGLIILGVDQGSSPRSVWIRVKTPTAIDSSPSAAAEPGGESHLRMTDGRKFPLDMSVGQAERIVAEARDTGSEFVEFPSKEGMVNVQFASDVDGIGAGHAFQLAPDQE